MERKAQAGASADIAIAASARFFRVLGDPTRLMILNYLFVRPHSVSDLIAKLGLPQSRVSNHLACLRWCQFVTADRVGRQVIYSVTDPQLKKLLRLAEKMASENQDHLAACRRIGPEWI